MSLPTTIPGAHENPNKIDEDISAILTLLKNRVDSLSQEVNFSQELLQQGVKTDLTTNIERTIKNPASVLIGIKKDVDERVKTIIHGVFASLFEMHKNLIQEVLKTKSESDLHYCIVLREDTFENRDKVFSILDIYDGIEFSSLFPVEFQFIPADFVSKIEFTEKITL